MKREEDCLVSLFYIPNEVKIKFIKNENDSITAEVIDNGIGIETNKVSGLGFEIFKVLSHDDWKIENLKDAPGCKLTLKFEKLIDNLSEMEMEKT
jgi:two-component sensor histidine kinase